MRHAGCSALRQYPARRIPGAAQFWRCLLFAETVISAHPDKSDKFFLCLSLYFGIGLVESLPLGST
jgi:hypothetical protein